MNWFFDPILKKYATFSGRASRKEYWMFTLIYMLIYVALTAVSAWAAGYGLMALAQMIYIGAVVIFPLVVLVPSVAITCRRLHDTGKSGWLQLIMLIPIVGMIVMVVFLATDSKPGENEYGANPYGK